MKTILQRAVLIFSLVLGLQTNVEAQLVYIPDPNFRAWINTFVPGCMVGDSIDPTCPNVLNTKFINVSSLGITDLTGIEVFVNDTILYCSYNLLTNFPVGPASLKTLDCSDNQLTSLSSLPNSLEKLVCKRNQLISLPTLPNTLKYLFCEGNQLTSLPTLPSSLIGIKCHFNQLTTLPTIPSNVDYIYCENNQLTSMPTLPNSLTYLSCYNNQLTSFSTLSTSLIFLSCEQNHLTSLPALPNSMKWLGCSYNPITSLPLLPISLLQLDCRYNYLTIMPSLPSSLTAIRCDNNQLTSMPSFPSTLNYIDCSENQIASLPALPDSLTFLNCRSNQLTSLPALPSSLIHLECWRNQLTSLPPLPSTLTYLNCQSNQLTSLPPLPDSLATFYCGTNPLTCLPKLNKVTNLNFTSTLVNCLPNYGNVTTSVPLVSSLPLCDVFNSNGCDVLWNIEGTTFIDRDTNCIIGNNEKGYANQKVKLYKNGLFFQQTYTNFNGNYDFDTFSNGGYKIELDTNSLPLDVNCPTSGFYFETIFLTDTMKYDRDFSLKCKGVDLAATSIYTLNLRPASLRTVNILTGDLTNFYGLNCSSGTIGTVTIAVTGACNYVSSPSYALTPTTAIGNVLTYSIADFGSISYDSTFDFNLLVDTTAVLGSQICITVSVSTASSEINYNNNQLTQCFTVVGSFDPNDKAAYPTTTLDISGNKWLNYTIRFQNTGTAEAEHVYITDTMSNLVDISTFTLLSYSHQPLMQIYNDGLVKFNFPNIHLPDSNSNEPESHGYVKYKIRAKDNLTVGSTIDNTANIFFDFNAPVITNTTSNLLINCSIPKTILNATICGGEAFMLNGQEYYNSGVYQQNIITAFGCDSVVELRLTVNTINNTITQGASTLQTSASATNYQWINCTTGTAIVGANTQTYNPTQSGNYAVVVDFGTCKDTSTCYYFSAVGLNEINASNISIQPNPFNNELKITLDKNYEGVIEVYNTIGALITSEKLQSRNVTLNTSNWNAGVYILKVATNAGVVVKKVIKR